MQHTRKISNATKLAQALHSIESGTGAVIPPVIASTTFARDDEYNLVQNDLSYGRDQNPGYRLVEEIVADLEGGKDALLFSSGMAAATALFLSLKIGAHVVAPSIMYHGLRDWLIQLSKEGRFDLELVDMTDINNLKDAVIPDQTELVWLETPCNPTWGITDISAAADIAHSAGAIVVADSTISTPLLTRPIDHGVDFVFHSATKYLNGHSDVIAGVLVCREENELWKRVSFERKYGGAILGPFEAWLLLRGMRTMSIRVKESCKSATLIASHLSQHPKIERVLYPGLESHPGHEIAKQQMTGGFGGVLSVLTKGDPDFARAVACNTKVFVPATSLGGVESLIEHRATIEGPNSPVSPNLLRFSIGIESVDDLIDDIDQALNIKI
ncbi:MAG: aminotransferase class I/II-fold pyridoxal phosphate-dependent enzyme [Proteobacteria bacterium]|nr:aminotransferase class I/II-fold pyridoxal phosphate-dependent enzyme [Pseudomonadota bacterium]